MRRWWLIGAVLALSVAVIVTLALVTPPNRLAGDAIAADPRAAGTDALGQLAELDDIRLTGWVGTETAQRLRVDIVGTSDGVQAIVNDEANGVAEFVVRDDQAAIKANAAWWLNTVPGYQQDYTGKWVKAEDGMGFPVSALAGLTGDRIEKLISDQAAAADWTATPVTFHDGQPAMALSLGKSGWQVFVSPTDPPRLLGIGGPLLDKVNRVRGGQPEGRAYPTAQFATTRPDGDCRKQADKKVNETAPKIGDLPQPEIPDIDERPQLQGSVTAPGGVCMTPVCPFTVTITNVGNGAGVGQVLITSSSGPPLPAPLNLPPGGTFTTVYNAPNPAPPSPGGRVTVPIFVQAFAQVTSLAGPDVSAGKRLNDRGIDPNNPVPGNPSAYGPSVTDILDKLTGNAPVASLARQDVVEQARELLGAALDAGLGTLLQQLVHSPALRYANDPTRTPLLALFEQAAKGDERERAVALRTLKHLVALTNGRPAPPTPDTAPVYVKVSGQSLTHGMDRGDAITIDDGTKQAYAKGYLKGGLTGQAAVDALYAELERAIALLNEDGAVPPGHAKVVEVTIKGDQNGTLGVLSRAQFRDLLRDGESKGRSFKDLLLKDGKPVINGLSVLSNASALPNRGAVGGALVFDSHDFTALGQSKTANPPEVPPESITPHFTPFSERHTFEGDVPDIHDKQGGGHGYGVGVADKTEYPEPWTPEISMPRAVEVANRAMQNKRDGTAHDGDTDTANGTRIDSPIPNKNQMDVEVNSWVIHGTSNGLELEITMLEDGTIVSVYPTGRVADENGRLQDYETIEDPANPNLPYHNPKLPSGKPKAELPQPGRPERTKNYAVSESRPPQYRRGTQDWVHRGTAQPGGGTNPKVPVEVVRDKDGKHKKTTVQQPPKQADPPPTVCPAN